MSFTDQLFRVDADTLHSAFVLETDLQLPESLIALARVLLSLDGEWEKARDKGKMPKPKIDDQVLSVTLQVLRSRLGEYPTTIEVGYPSVCF